MLGLLGMRYAGMLAVLVVLAGWQAGGQVGAARPDMVTGISRAKLKGPPSCGTQGERSRGCKVTHYGGIVNAIIDVSRFELTQKMPVILPLCLALPCPARSGAAALGGGANAICMQWAMAGGLTHMGKSTTSCTSPQTAPQRGVLDNVSLFLSSRSRPIVSIQLWYNFVHSGQAYVPGTVQVSRSAWGNIQ